MVNHGYNKQIYMLQWSGFFHRDYLLILFKLLNVCMQKGCANPLLLEKLWQSYLFQKPFFANDLEIKISALFAWQLMFSKKSFSPFTIVLRFVQLLVWLFPILFSKNFCFQPFLLFQINFLTFQIFSFEQLKDIEKIRLLIYTS